MAFQPIEDGGSIVVTILDPLGTVMNNVFHFELLVPLTQSVADDISEVFADFYDSFNQYWNNGFRATEVLVTDLRTEDGGQARSSDGFPIVGTSSAEPLPYQIAALISWNASGRGADRRGRTYLPGFVETASDGAQVISAARTAIQSGIDALVAVFPALSIASRVKDGALRDPGVLHAITDGTIHNHWRTQRRRAEAGF